ncbi:hypothetical protein STAS_10763 [Striga asiatica]|uniref:Uncharacterized protein n=1 Tax=Striga asiatica TaxID=4170 RepID=A0A5A7PPF5_STRAF|nr:hypothetical protein STAS_10763 [Striga asiatica]
MVASSKKKKKTPPSYISPSQIGFALSHAKTPQLLLPPFSSRRVYSQRESPVAINLSSSLTRKLHHAITLPHRRLQLHLREPPSLLHSSASPPPPAIHPAAARLRFPESSSDVFFLFVRTTSPIVRLTPALRSPVVPSVHRRDHLCGIPLSGQGFFQ